MLKFNADWSDYKLTVFQSSIIEQSARNQMLSNRMGALLHFPARTGFGSELATLPYSDCEYALVQTSVKNLTFLVDDSSLFV